MDEFRLGQRVRDENGSRGTVEYIGPVVTSKQADAVWIGIEWDDETRGKHDGAVIDENTGASHRYFQCAQPKSGSFVKPKKLDGGVSFIEALRSRYVKMDAPLEAPNSFFENAFANTKRGATKPIEFRGELKVRGVQQLDDGHVNSVAMRCSGINGLGMTKNANDSTVLARLTTLDLQCNLFSSWKQLDAMIHNLPALQALDISGNRLGIPSIEETINLRSKLHRLAANRVGLSSWSDLIVLMTNAPHLEYLHLAGHSSLCTQSLSQVDTARAPLRMLDLADCGLEENGAAALPALLPKLDELHASQNASLKKFTSTFSQVTTLAIASCGFEHWSNIDILNTSFPKLLRLRFGNDNPLVRGLGPSEARAFLISRLPNLIQLNGADIKPRERKEAEKRYLRVALAHKLHDDQDQDKFGLDTTLAKTRLDELVRLYPEVVAAHERACASSAPGLGHQGLSASFLTIHLRSAAAATADAPIVSEQLPASTKISLLKRICAKRFDLAAKDQLLYYKPDDDDMPLYLDNDDASLAYFGLVDGSTIDVGEKLL